MWRVVLVALVVTIWLGLLARVVTFATGISTRPALSSDLLGRLGGGPRTNLLVLGYGGEGHDGAFLTDTLLVLSVDLASGATAEISIPRDLWVQIPAGSGHYAKINSAFATGMVHGDIASAAELATRKAQDVLGIEVPYWITLDFQGFRALIDALGGVDLEVERGFSSRYPANDDPSVDASWTTVSFPAGPQHLDGERALQFSRARYADDPREASDFARARRQQLVVKAALDRARGPQGFARLLGVLAALEPHLRTNLAAPDLALLALKAHPGDSTKIVLDDSTVLRADQSTDGQFILVPRDTWQQVQDYVHESLPGR